MALPTLEARRCAKSNHCVSRRGLSRRGQTSGEAQTIILQGMHSVFLREESACTTELTRTLTLQS